MGTSSAAGLRVADAIVERLKAHRVRRVFAVAGESYLDVLDALFDARGTIELITCRHEAAAANMAEATAKLTGRCGVAFVTRGPGLAHASIGVHTAQQDATPMVLFVGEIAREDRYRRAFQEVNLALTFADLAKGVLQIDVPGRAAEIVDRALQLATAGRPGPVIVGLPEDVLGEVCASVAGAAPVRIEAPSLAPALARAIGVRLAASERPLLWVGGSGWSAAGVDALRQFAETWELPVVTSFRRKDRFPNGHASYAGECGFGTPPTLIERLRGSDLLLVLGAPLGDVETGGYHWLDRATTAARLIHVHPDSETLGAVFPAGLAVQAAADEAAAALANLEPPSAPRRWAAWTRAARAEHLAFGEPVAVGGDVNLSVLFRELRASLPPTAIVTNGAGNYAAWLHRFFAHDAFGTQLAPGSGAMGYAVPAAIAAKLEHPEREVVCVAGDGCFLMASQELATAAALGLGILFLVVNNGSYGTIRMHQENRFPGRTIGTTLRNPDFTALARAYGLHAARVGTTAGFAPALAAARAAGGPAMIEVLTSVDDIAPGRRLSGATA
ncbi:MAG: thiamine pyrophosphate-binding protein [Gammaproteobacteria bacterium]|nr:thiamine pyrophosphate-binding protein [Gammaproteobacteria bacterium]